MSTANERKRSNIAMDNLMVVSWFNEVVIDHIGLAKQSAMFESSRLAIDRGDWPLKPVKINGRP